MPKRIYLIRHAKPEMPEGKKLCLGSRTDVALGAEGKDQAEKLAGLMKDTIAEAKYVFSSPQKRARETADVIAGDKAVVVEEEDLREIDMGEWDGRDFDTIKENYPELYARRGEDISIAPPGGEEYAEAAERIRRAVIKCLRATDSEEIIIISHAGAIKAFLCSIVGAPFKESANIRLNYCGVNLLGLSGNGTSFTIEAIGLN